MCGIIGITAKHNVSKELFEGLLHLQHRGQDAAGILTCDTTMHRHVGYGKAVDVFDDTTLSKLTGHFGLGHLRYPTQGLATLNEAQPLITNIPQEISLVHNGHINNHETLKAQLAKANITTTGSSDSELLLQYFALLLTKHPQAETPTEQFTHFCNTALDLSQSVKGAYSLIITIVGIGLMAFRDPNGIRPLLIGERQAQGSIDYGVASEDVALRQLGFANIQDIQPGELVFMSTQGSVHRQIISKSAFRPCALEYVYFARPDATLNQVNVYQSRVRMGEQLARAWKKAYPDTLPDVVVPIPFTANTSAISFAQALGIRYAEGLYKNAFVGRTFMMSPQEKRSQAIKTKLAANHTEIANQNVLLFDDSIVRGTTSKAAVNIVRQAGAKAVYLVSACPPIRYPCHYGIAIPNKEELIAHQHQTQEEIAKELNVDKLLYQSADALQASISIKMPCMACMLSQS